MSDQQPPAQPSPEQPQEPLQSPPPNVTPPGYPPQQNVPPGFAPPGSIPPGYAPPNYMPPPGYGTPQPQPTGYPAYPQGAYYPPAMFVYPPPREYAIPPAFPGQPWQTVPPAEGSLLQAWISVGTKITRQNIASWAQASKRGWTAGSIITYLAIVLLPFLAFALWGVLAGPGIIQNLIVSTGQTISASDVQRLQGGIIIGAVVIVIVVPLTVLASLYTTTFFWALFMPATLGTLGERIRRAIKSYVLVLPASALALLIAYALAGGVIAFVASSIHFSGTITNPGPSTTTQASSLFFMGALIFDAFSLVASAYTITLTLQAGSVGTTLSQWAVFGINLLAGFVLSIVVWVIFFITVAITSAFFAPQHINTSTGAMLMPILHAIMLR